jgi:hypothetical protein
MGISPIVRHRGGRVTALPLPLDRVFAVSDLDRRRCESLSREIASPWSPRVYQFLSTAHSPRNPARAL